MLARLMGGGRPVPETRKLFLILRLLTLRARRPDPFATGAYEPVEAGERVCAFTRGGEVFVAVAVREGANDGVIAAPEGTWRDVLRGDERSFSRREPASSVLGEHGIAVFERLGR
jgi:(1->4)-alpha-D-glucan 1-alpha-D-glucosylmutase